MRILVIGAGAIGGYFGGRLMEKGEDITFLVRENRYRQLTEGGLVVNSIHGDMKLTPKLLRDGERADPFDVVLLATKAYHLNGAIKSMRPYIGEETMILPLLNGIAHIDKLVEEFGEKRILGGLCFIETTLNEKGHVVQTSPVHRLVFGERNGEETERIKTLQTVFEGTKGQFEYSKNINQSMWEKYLFIATFSGITTLMRAPIGPIREAMSGKQSIKQICHEVQSIMQSMGAPITSASGKATLEKIAELNAEMKSSMQRDMEKGMATEADHFFHYLLEHANFIDSTPILHLIFTNLKVYESSI
ncbi:ketopantoate reductase family protein [Heyndrickxia oleronia]|uniref:ketopantoate reductase family protein n=1 Tax=Heyndrickxia oleronia TaxID=38875 RepID=UPI00333B9A5E